MDQDANDVMVNGLRCQVVRHDGERLLIQPRTSQGFGINVTRWVALADAQPVSPQSLASMVLSDEEIRQLAAVLRQVFYEDSAPAQVQPAS